MVFWGAMASTKLFSCMVSFIVVAVLEPATGFDRDPWLGAAVNGSLYDTRRVFLLPLPTNKWLFSCTPVLQTQVGQCRYGSVGSSTIRNHVNSDLWMSLLTGPLQFAMP